MTVNPDLNSSVTDARIADWLRGAERFRRARVEWGDQADPFETVTVRLARAVDANAVARLAARDGRRVPVGPTLVAEVGGVVLAARSLEDGGSVADPFRPTAHLTELLELRAVHLRNASNGKHVGSGRGLMGWLRALRRRRGALS
jgi:hypothetical protein